MENFETTEQLLELGAATLGESGGEAMAARISAAWPGAAVAGPAYPVHCTPGDNLAIHVAVTKAPAGSVLVVDVGHIHELGYWGEVLTTAAEYQGVVGLVIDGGVRDVAGLASHSFPAFSTMIALRGATKNQPGTVGLPAKVGGVVVSMGDWVVGDVDGVTVLSAATLEQVVAAGRERLVKEQGFFSSLNEGATTVSLLGLDASLITGD